MRRRTAFFFWVCILILIFVVTLFASFLTPYEPNTMDMNKVYQAPNTTHLLGTDHLGRDVLTRLLEGGKVTLLVAVGSTLISFMIGLFYGGLSGYRGGKLDMLMMRCLEVLVTIPSLLVILVFQAFMQGSIWSILLIIGLTSWYSTARIIRTEFITLKQLEFVQMAKMLGTPVWKILIQHLLRNSIQAIFVVTLFNFASAVFIEVSLSFLGIGVSAAIPTWGNMLYNAQNDLLVGAWWAGVFPGVLIFLTVLSINFIGSALGQHARRSI